MRKLPSLSIVGAALAQTPSPNEKKTISITWLRYAVFDIISPAGTHFLIVPFLTILATAAGNEDLGRYYLSHILVTDSDGDHLGDAVDLAKPSRQILRKQFDSMPVRNFQSQL